MDSHVETHVCGESCIRRIKQSAHDVWSQLQHYLYVFFIYLTCSAQLVQVFAMKLCRHRGSLVSELEGLNDLVRFALLTLACSFVVCEHWWLNKRAGWDTSYCSHSKWSFIRHEVAGSCWMQHQRTVSGRYNSPDVSCIHGLYGRLHHAIGIQGWCQHDRQCENAAQKFVLLLWC